MLGLGLPNRFSTCGCRPGMRAGWSASGCESPRGFSSPIPTRGCGVSFEPRGPGGLRQVVPSSAWPGFWPDPALPGVPLPLLPRGPQRRDPRTARHPHVPPPSWRSRVGRFMLDRRLQSRAPAICCRNVPRHVRRPILRTSATFGPLLVQIYRLLGTGFEPVRLSLDRLPSPIGYPFRCLVFVQYPDQDSNPDLLIRSEA